MRRKIIIADDEPITRIDIAEILVETGYDVVGQAADGFDAIELCKKHNPDLVIMDVKMPFLDGLKAAKIINEENLAKGIVLLTAYSGKEFIEQAKSVGVLNYLIKPISEKALIPAIEIAISKSEEFQKIIKESQNLNEKIESRIIIERAKGVLSVSKSYSEKESYNYIRNLSMNKRCSMRAIAEIIIYNR